MPKRKLPSPSSSPPRKQLRRNPPRAARSRLYGPTTTPAAVAGPSTAPTQPKKGDLVVTEVRGDLFSAPANTLLVHACNCQGLWGAGIAAAFRRRYPAAHGAMKAHCKAHRADALLGTAQLIAPDFGAGTEGNESADAKGKGKAAVVETEPEAEGSASAVAKGKRPAAAAKQQRPPAPVHFVGNLYTSLGVGSGKSAKTAIVAATGPSMRHLLELVAAWNAAHEDEAQKVHRIWMCKINSGLFGIKWENSLDALKGVMVPEGEVPEEVTVVEL